MRELLRAVVTGKPLVPLFSTDRSQGGLTLDEASTQMRANYGHLRGWGVIDEVEEWGYPLPTYEVLHEALFQRAAILEWHTLPAYRDASLRMIAETVLAAPAISHAIRNASSDLANLHDSISERAFSPRATPTTAAAVELPSFVTATAAMGSSSMSEDEAATVIAAAERGRVARKLNTDMTKMAAIVQRKASWAAARAKSKAVLVTNVASTALSGARLLSPRSPGTSEEVSLQEDRPERSTSKPVRCLRATYLSCCPSHASLPPLRPPQAPRKFHIYCSIHNAGASALLSELHDEMRRRGLPPTALLWTDDDRAMGQCEHFLLLCARLHGLEPLGTMQTHTLTDLVLSFESLPRPGSTRAPGPTARRLTRSLAR